MQTESMDNKTNDVQKPELCGHCGTNDNLPDTPELKHNCYCDECNIVTCENCCITNDDKYLCPDCSND